MARISMLDGYGDLVGAAYGAAMSGAVAALQFAAGAVRARVSAERSIEVLSLLAGPMGFTVNFLTSTDEAKKAVLSGLKTIDSIIQRLNSSSREEVLNGTMDPAKWIASAKTVAEGISEQLKVLRESSTAANLSAQISLAIDDFKKLGAKLPDALPWLPWVIGGAVLIYVGPALLNFAAAGRRGRVSMYTGRSRPKLAGYRRKRRR